MSQVETLARGPSGAPSREGPSQPGPRRGSATFTERLSGRANAFGLLRLVFASAVIFSHAFYIGHWPTDPTYEWSNHQSDIGNVGVLGFFVVSGYLITRSAASTPFVPYLWRRILRIFPAFLTVLVLSAFVLAPWFYRRSHGSMAGYLGGGPTGEHNTLDGGPVGYVARNAGLKIQQYGIHDVFTDSPWVNESGAHVSVINGSLWTLYFEWLCYLLVGGLALLGLLRRARWLVPLAAGTAMASSLWLGRVPVLDVALAKTFGDLDGLRLASMFLIGATAAVYARRIPCDGRLAAAAATVAVGTFFTGWFFTLGYLGIGYLVLWAAAVLPASTHRIGARNDISYGIYIYAWPVQMALSAYGVSHWGYVPFVALTFLIVVPLAWLSWKLVEQPSMAWKNRGPGRWRWSRTAAAVEPIPSPAPVTAVPRTARGCDTVRVAAPEPTSPCRPEPDSTPPPGLRPPPPIRSSGIRPSDVGRRSVHPTRHRNPRLLQPRNLQPKNGQARAGTGSVSKGPTTARERG